MNMCLKTPDVNTSFHTFPSGLWTCEQPSSCPNCRVVSLWAWLQVIQFPVSGKAKPPRTQQKVQKDHVAGSNTSVAESCSCDHWEVCAGLRRRSKRPGSLQQLLRPAVREREDKLHLFWLQLQEWSVVKGGMLFRFPKGGSRETRWQRFCDAM